MSVTLRPYASADLEALRALVTDPSLRVEYEALQGPGGLEVLLRDPFFLPSAAHLAWAGNRAVGFAAAYLLRGREGRWAMLRGGVLESHRRHGIGSRLLAAAAAAALHNDPALDELCLGAWQPSPAASGFAARHGYAHARFYWLMERPSGGLPAPAWPRGIETRVFDGSERALEDWNTVYNASFAEHYHGVESTVAVCRHILTIKGAEPSGLLLAYRDGRCVGFCRNHLFEARGEIGVLGVVREERGIGLGRALLRWGVEWLERQRTPRVTLMVDGENENALGLYRSEGFDVTRTREIWSRPNPPGATRRD